MPPVNHFEDTHGGVAFAWPIVGKQYVIRKTRVTIGRDLVVRLGDWSRRLFFHRTPQLSKFGGDKEAVKCVRPAVRSCLSELELTHHKSKSNRTIERCGRLSTKVSSIPAFAHISTRQLSFQRHYLSSHTITEKK